MRILFCNIAWMNYYKGIVWGKDEPQNGGSYVKETLDAHEKYNFEAIPLTGERRYGSSIRSGNFICSAMDFT